MTTTTRRIGAWTNSGSGARENRPWKLARAAGTAGSLLAVGPALAQIAGEQVAAGQASFARQGNFTTITAANNTIINYRQFDVRAGETVRFVQPDALARVLNRINSAVPSRIDGNITANGRVYIVNPAGVYFGQGAMINVGGIYAAAANISNADFLNGVNRFQTSGGKVVNQGVIQADVVGLIGSSVFNFGAVEAPAGSVAMIAGKDVLLGERDGHVYAKIEGAAEKLDPVGPAAPGSEPVASSPRRAHFGAADVFGMAVWNKGTVKAREVHLESAGGSTVVQGRVDASGAAPGQPGGSVKILGDMVSVRDAVVDASGDAGGGQVLIGGNFQGNGIERNAQHTRVTNSSLRADAVTRGDGGTVIVWADGSTRATGELSARGGREGGDGGFAEISGKHTLRSSMEVDLRAPRGETGTILYDPLDIVIQGGTADGSDGTDTSDALLKNNTGADGSVLFDDVGDADPFIVTESEIEGTNANIILQAGRSITTSGDFANNDVKLVNNRTLTLQTRNSAADGAGSINLTGSVDGDNLEFTVSDSTGGNTSKITISGSTSGEETCSIVLPKIKSNGADVTVTTGKGAIVLQGDINAGAGTVRLGAEGTVTQNGGSITADRLGIRAAGHVELPSGNDVTTFAAVNNTANAHIRYIDAGGITVGSVDADGTLFDPIDGVSTTGATSDIFLASGVGALQVAQPLSAGAGTVRLTGSSVSQSSSGIITAGTLAVQAFGTDITLDQGNDADTVALIAPNARFITFKDTDGFTIGNTTELDFGSERIDNLSGVQFWIGSTDVWNGAGDILLAGGPISITQPVDGRGTQTLGGNVRLLASGDITQSATGPVTGERLAVRSTAGNVTLDQANNDVKVFASSTEARNVTFRDVNALEIGSIVAGGTTALPFAAVTGVNTTTGSATITAEGILEINSATTVGTGDPAGTARLTLSSGGTVDQTARIVADNLSVSANGLINLTNGANDAGDVALLTQTNGIFYTDADGVNLTSLAPLSSGISTDNENATILAGGPIGITADLNVGTGILSLETTSGDILQTGGSIIAKALSAEAGGSINLIRPTNDVDEFAALAKGTGNVTFVDQDFLLITTVNALGGVTAGGNILVQAGRGLRVFESLDAGGDLELRAAYTTGDSILEFIDSGLTLKGDSITLVSGNGPASGLGSKVKVDANFPTLRGDAANTSPGTFKIINDGSIGDADIPPASKFAGGVAGVNYTLASREGSVTINAVNAPNLNNTNLTLTVEDEPPSDKVSINTPLTLRGLTVNGPITTGSIDVGTGTLEFNGKLTFNAPSVVFTADEVNFGPGSELLKDASVTDLDLTLRPSTAARNINVGIENDDAAAFDITEAELAKLRTIELKRLTIGADTGNAILNVTGRSALAAVEFADPVALRMGQGRITVSKKLAGTDNATVLFNSGSPTVLSADVTTEGDTVTFSGEVEIAENIAVRTTAGSNPAGANITFEKAVNNAVGDAKDLTLDAGTGGLIKLRDSMGAGRGLGSIDFRSEVALEPGGSGPGVTIKTAGSADDDVLFNKPVKGPADLTVDAGAGEILVADVLGGSTAADALRSFTAASAVNAPGVLTVNAPVASTGLTNPTITFRKDVTAGGKITLNGNTVTAPATAGAPLTISTAGAAGGGADIEFKGTLDGDGALTLNAGTGAITLEGDAGQAAALRALSATGAGLTIRSVTTIGPQTYTGPLTIAGPSAFLRSSTGPGGGIRFNNDATAQGSVTLQSNNSDIGALTSAGFMTFNGPSTLRGPLTTTGADSDLTFNGPVNLNAGSGTINMATQGTGSEIRALGKIDGASRLVLTSRDGAGGIEIQDSIGSVTPLASFTSNGALAVNPFAADRKLSITTAGADANIEFRGASVTGNSASLTLVTPGFVNVLTNMSTRELDVSGRTRLGGEGKGVSVATTAPASKNDAMKFRGAVTLMEDASITASSGTVFFASSIDTDPSAPAEADLSITTLAQPTLDLAGGVANVTPVKIAGNVGVIRPLRTLGFETAYADGSIPAQATIVFAGFDPGAGQAGFRPDGSLVINPGFNPTAAANTRTVRTTNAFVMAKGQKLTSFGNLDIGVSNGGAQIGDITALGNITVSAASINILGRSPSVNTSNLFRRGDSLQPGFPAQPDLGTDLVAKDSIVFNVPNGRDAITGTARTVFVATETGKGATINGSAQSATDPFLLPADFDGPVSASRFLPSDLGGAVFSDLSTVGLALDLAFNTEQPSGLAQSLASALPSDQGRGEVANTVSLSGSLRKQLEDIGIYTKDEETDVLGEGAARLAGKAVYNDVPPLKVPQGALGDYTVSSTRLSRPAVMAVLAAYDDLAGPDAAARPQRYLEMKDSLRAGWDRYKAQLPEGTTANPPAFRRYLEITPTESANVEILNKLRTALDRLERLGLSGVEVRVPKDALLQQIAPDPDITPANLEIAAKGM